MFCDPFMDETITKKDKKEYYYDYCYILLSTTPFPTKIHKKTAQLSKFYPISKKNRSVFSPLIKTILRGEKIRKKNKFNTNNRK